MDVSVSVVCVWNVSDTAEVSASCDI